MHKTKLNLIDKNASARVINIDEKCKYKQRLIDMGFSADTEVLVVLKGNGITAYHVRGTLLALRHKDAGYINVLPL